MEKRLIELREEVEHSLRAIDVPTEPANLYEPIRYILELGGKRIRPILTLMGCELMGGHRNDALDQAMAIEIFHNFTLVHDDIMDKADVRRGLPTVHKKWDENIGILSGDGMMVVAYQYLAKAPAEKLPALLNTFSSTALLVCEGQQLDMDYARRSDVRIEEYNEMIKCKTAVLLGGAMQLGAIVGGATSEDLDRIKVFAEEMGLAFQLRDDYLDSFGDSADFGKQIGGDIREGKRTWLTIKAFELANDEQRKRLLDAFNNEIVEQRIEDVIAVYEELNIQKRVAEQIEYYSDRSAEALNAIEGKEEVKEELRALVGYLMGRTS